MFNCLYNFCHSVSIPQLLHDIVQLYTKSLKLRNSVLVYFIAYCFIGTYFMSNSLCNLFLQGL